MAANNVGSFSGASLYKYFTSKYKTASGTSDTAYNFTKGAVNMAKKKELPSLWERSEYDVISETETETELIAVLKTKYSGATVICHIPKYTKEEEEKIAADVTYAHMQIAFIGQDISHMKNMEILMD